jgi:FkbM family methyltransferase
VTTTRVVRNIAERLLPERVRVHLQAYDHLWHGEPELALLKRVCPPRRIAVDVGANIGTYTYFLRRLAARVHAYEPNPELATRLRRLYPDVIVRNVALSDRSAEVVLHVPAGEGRDQHELGSIAQSFDVEGHAYKVEAVTLDSERLQDVGFLKIDVEQHERQVLRGALETIKTSRPAILSEVYPLLYEERMDRVFAFVTELRYRGWFGFAGRFLPFEKFDPAVHANPANWGKPNSFMSTNVFFFPVENPLANSGPSGS